MWRLRGWWSEFVATKVRLHLLIARFKLQCKLAASSIHQLEYATARMTISDLLSSPYQWTIILKYNNFPDTDANSPGGEPRHRIGRLYAIFTRLEHPHVAGLKLMWNVGEDSTSDDVILERARHEIEWSMHSEPATDQESRSMLRSRLGNQIKHVLDLVQADLRVDVPYFCEPWALRLVPRKVL
jgi:hypothetical protein